MTDTELRDIREWAAKVCGYSGCIDGGEAWYVPQPTNVPWRRCIRKDQWLPDQNIAQAFEVAEAVMRSGELPHFDLHCMSPSRRWSAHIEFGFEKPGGKSVGGHASDESCCRAILLAARQAHAALSK